MAQTHDTVIDKLGRIGLIPVIKLDSPEQALPLGRALMAGSLPVAEVTFRTDAAAASIRILSRELPELILGAGTVLTTDQADAAIEAGARYIVTPGFNPRVVAHCISRNVPVTPGVTTPSQIEAALEMGLGVLKFFPAEQAGGIPMLKAFAGPYGSRVAFIPTGGIGPQNLADYLACPNVHAVGGSWMVPTDAIAAGDFAKIERLCREARIQSLGFSLLHIGINPDGETDPEQGIQLLSAMLGLSVRDTSLSAFVGKSYEIMKVPGRGAHGHIAIETASVERALEWLATFDVHPIPETVKEKNGNIALAYLDKPFMGFALHLSRRT